MYKEGQLNYCKNYAIFIYNYLDYNVPTNIGNIGDYIQSLSALQFLPKNCFPFCVDRDRVEFCKGPKAIIIMNGWYNISIGNRFTSGNLSPKYISFHINNIQNIDKISINSLFFKLNINFKNKGKSFKILSTNWM